MKKHGNSAVFVTARLASSRLPGKALKLIHGKPVIWHVLSRAIETNAADQVILCTTENDEDQALCAVARDLGIPCFRGSEPDKLMRWRGAAQKFGVDYIVTADGDDLFCDPALSSLALTQLKEGGVDFISSSRVVPGLFTYAFSAIALEKVCEIKDTENTEMMWVYFTQTNIFKCEELAGDISGYQRDGVRVTLDYQEDLDFFTKVYKDLCGFPIDSRLILQHLDSHVEVCQINAFRDEQWKSNQVNKTVLKLKPEYRNLVSEERCHE